MHTIKHRQVTWINIENPNNDDLLYLRNNFNIHPLVIEELVTPTIQPQANIYDECVFLTIHVTLFDQKKRTSYPGEIDIVLTRTHLITTHKNEIFPIKMFFNELLHDEEKREFYMSRNPAKLLHQVLNVLLEAHFPQLNHIHKNIDYIEDKVFEGYEKEMVQEISIVKRDILNFKRTIKPQKSVIESLTKMRTPYIPENLKIYFQDLIGTNTRIWNSLESAKETIESLEDTNNSLLSNKLNLTMKVLTIFSAVMLPMTVYSNILAMSADIPFGTHPFGFWIHMVIMFVISVFTIVIFKIRRWI